MATFEEVLKQFFVEADVSKDGKLGELELHGAMDKAGLEEDFYKTANWFKLADTTGDMKLSFDELLVALQKVDPIGTRRATAVLLKKLKEMDTDGSGNVSFKELKAAMDGMGTADIFDMFSKMDKDGDGKVSEKEFLDFYKKTMDEKMSTFSNRMESLFKKHSRGNVLDFFQLHMLMRDAGITEKSSETQKFLDQIDTSGDKKISWAEFKEAFDKFDANGKMRAEADVRFQFMMMDKDGSKALEPTELKKAIKDGAQITKIPGLKRVLDIALLKNEPVKYNDVIEQWKAAQ